MVHLDAQPAVVGEQSAEGPGETEQIGNVRVDVVGDHEVRRTVFGAHRRGQSARRGRRSRSERHASRAAAPTLTEGSIPRHGMPAATAC